MIITPHLKIKLIICVIFYVCIGILFSKIPFFKEEEQEKTYINKNIPRKTDWLKVLLFSIIPTGLLFYLLGEFIDESGIFHFHGIPPTDNLL